jgi:NADH-quinone oxidoreductase subunit N
VEFFLANLVLFYIFYAASYDNSRLYSQPNLLRSTTSFTIFSFALLLFSFKPLAEILVCSPFVSALGGSLFSLFFKAIVLASGIFLLLIAKEYLATKGVFRYEYDIFLCFSFLGLVLLASADDFLAVYLSIELQSICFYILATFQRNSEFSVEAGLKYFVLGAFSSGLLLFGFFLLYFIFGTASFGALTKIAAASPYTTTSPIEFWGFFFVVLAFFFKLGAAPLHMWLCDVYDGCLIPVTAFFATVPKVVLFGVLIKIYSLLFSGYQEFSIILFLYAGVLSICLAATSGLYQKRVKRLIAYSAISHTGFLLLGISAGSTTSCVIYLFLYVLMSLAIFSILLLVGTGKATPKYLIS